MARWGANSVCLISEMECGLLSSELIYSDFIIFDDEKSPLDILLPQRQITLTRALDNHVTTSVETLPAESL